VEPAFLDGLAANPNQTFPVTLGSHTFNASLADIIYDATTGDFHHPNTMTCRLMAGEQELLSQKYYSVGGGFIEWEGYTPPQKGAPRYPYQRMAELLNHARQHNLSFAQVAMANEVSVSGKTEAAANAYLDVVIGAMRAIVARPRNASGVLPGPDPAGRPKPATFSAGPAGTQRIAARRRPSCRLCPCRFRRRMRAAIWS
jgi:L-serine dehydratase